MNSLDTHDTLRAITLLGTGGDGKDHDKAWRAQRRLTDEERQRGKALLKLASLILYAFPGSPTLYYGDEAGLEGYEDPFNRRTFPWGSEDQDLTAWFAALGMARKGSQALRRGELEWLCCEGRVLSFLRKEGNETVLCAVNAGDEPTLLPLPEGCPLTLAAGEGKLLEWKAGSVCSLL